MAAQPSPTIQSVSTDGLVMYFRNGKPLSHHYTDLDKVAMIAVAKFLGYRFTGMTPLRWDKDDIVSAIAESLAKRDGRTVPKIPNPSTQEVPTMNQPKVEHAIQELLKAVQSDNVPTLDMDAVRQIVDEVTAPMEVRQAVVIGDVTTLTTEVVNMKSTLHGQARDLAHLAQTVSTLQPKITKVIIGDRIIKELHGVQHSQFPKVLSALGARLSIMMVGPAGTGKTTIASRAADALGLDFSSKSCTSQTTESSLVGFINAAGHYVTTEFRKRFEEGGVFLLDEVDNANPNVLGVLNSALANGEMAFPDGMVKRHTDFVCVAAGNTYGNGATAEYVGRNPIDAATKDRFVFVDIAIDDAVEQAMLDSIGLDAEVANRWLGVVRSARRNVESYGLKVVVSPRATQYGATLLKAGWVMQDVVGATLLKGAKPDQQAKILEGVTI